MKLIFFFCFPRSQRLTHESCTGSKIRSRLDYFTRPEMLSFSCAAVPISSNYIPFISSSNICWWGGWAPCPPSWKQASDIGWLFWLPYLHTPTPVNVQISRCRANERRNPIIPRTRLLCVVIHLQRSGRRRLILYKSGLGVNSTSGN
jgi:hypothetical protein